MEGFYRAKRADNKKWIYGNLIKTREGWYIVKRTASINDLEPIKVIPKTIGQYIKLKDINKKKIYRKDIVEVYDVLKKIKFRGVVDFKNGSFVIKDINGIIHYRWVDYEVKVIGNIFENKNLLSE